METNLFPRPYLAVRWRLAENATNSPDKKYEHEKVVKLKSHLGVILSLTLPCGECLQALPVPRLCASAFAHAPAALFWNQPALALCALRTARAFWMFFLAASILASDQDCPPVRWNSFV